MISLFTGEALDGVSPLLEQDDVLLTVLALLLPDLLHHLQ